MHRRFLSMIAAGLLIVAAGAAAADPILEWDSQHAAEAPTLHTEDATLDAGLKASSFVNLGLVLAQLVALKGETSPPWGEMDRSFDDFSSQLIIDRGLCTAPLGKDPAGPIPEPGTFLMLGLGLIGLVAFDRRICKNR